MSIRKFRASRVNTTTGNIYVGQYGDMFYDEGVGLLKISDGHTAGGHYVSVLPATSTMVGGIKAGPGANVSVDGTLTINTAGLPLNIGDLAIAQANISTVNPNENLNLISNGTGSINLVGNLHAHTTAQNWYGDGTPGDEPIFEVNNFGNIITRGNLIINGKSYFYGNVTEIGNLTVTGNSVNNGTTTFNGLTVINGDTIRTGNTTQSGNITITGNSTNTGASTFNGLSTFNGNVVTNGNLNITGNTYQLGNLTITGTTVNNGLSVFNGNLNIVGNAALIGNTTVTGNTLVTGTTTVTGNTLVTGNTTVTGNTSVIGTTYLTGNSYVTGNTFVTGTTTVTGNTFVTGQVTTITGNTYLTGNSFITGAATVTGPTTVTGNVTVTGNMLQSGESIFNITQQNSVQGAVEITGDANALWQTPINTGVMLHVTGQSNLQNRFYVDALGNYNVITGRRFEGTMASPTGVQGNIDLIRYSGVAYNTSGWANIGPARMSITTNEIQTATNQGGRIEFWTTANSAGPAYSTISRTATIDPALGVTATGFVTTGNVSAGNVIITNNESVGGNVVVTGNVTASNVNATLHGNVVGVATGLATAGTTAAGTFLMGQVTVPATTIGKASSADNTCTITGLTTSHKVIVTPAADLSAGVTVSAAYPSSTNTLTVQLQNSGGGLTTSTFSLTYIAWV